MPKGSLNRSDSVLTDLLTTFPTLEAHPWDDIRKRQYRAEAECWYMEPTDFLRKFGSNHYMDKNGYQWVRNNLIANGYSTDQFSIGITTIDKLPTVVAYRIDKNLPNRFGV